MPPPVPKKKKTHHDKKFLIEYGELHPIDAEQFHKKDQDLLLQIQKRQSGLKPVQDPKKKIHNRQKPDPQTALDCESQLKVLHNLLNTDRHLERHIEPVAKPTYQVPLTPIPKELDLEAFERFISDEDTQKISQFHSFQADYGNFTFDLNSPVPVNSASPQNSPVPLNSSSPPPSHPIALALNSFHNALIVLPDFHQRKPMLRNLISAHLAKFLNQMALLQSRESAPVPDSGFTRPKVLVLCPMKNSAYEIVKQIIAHSPGCTTHHHQGIKRFEQEFSAQPTSTTPAKGEEYSQIFGGNCEDAFLLGISFNPASRKMKFFTAFEQADLIVASPVALRQALEKEGVECLSSIQIVLVDSADVIQMQNWDHLEWIIKNCNLIPKQTPKECDISRLRACFADAQGASRRQFICTSSISSLFIQGLFNRQCTNSLNGKASFKPRTLEPLPCTLNPPYAQCTKIFPTKSLSTLADDRFQVFFSHLWKPLSQDCTFEESKSGHTIIFISCYFDFLRLKAAFDKQDVDYESLTEYTSDPNVTRIRGWFFNGQTRFLVVTERFLFYKRYKIRGARRIVFYSLPEMPSTFELLSEMLEQQGSSEGMSVLATRADLMKMERIWGSERAARMVSRCTGDAVVEVAV